MTAIPLVDLRAQYRDLKDEIDAALLGVVERGDFILGEDVQAFEREWAEYCGTTHAVGLDSGISALELGLRASGIGAGDEVITPVNSFIASSSAISFTGAVPVWVDCDPATFNLDLGQVEAAITPRTKAIMPVHLYGRPADMDGVREIASRHGLIVAEDACQAHGAWYGSRRAGSLGDFAAFSFYPGKNLGAYGDAGALTTNDPVLAERLRTMRNYGQRQKYDHAELAWNRRLDTLQAAVLRVKLRHLDGWNQARARHAEDYRELLDGSALGLPAPAAAGEHVHHQFVVQAEDRDALAQRLAAEGVATGIHYPIPIHLQEAYQQLGFGPGSFPHAERLAGSILSLPMYPELTREQIERVARAAQRAVATA